LKPFKFIISILTILVYSNPVQAQNKRISKTIFISTDTIQFDSLSVFEHNFKIRISDSTTLSPLQFYLNGNQSKLFLRKKINSDSITIEYSYLPLNLSFPFKHKSDTLISPEGAKENIPYYNISTLNKNEDLFGSNSLQKQGSISRGITVGNTQSLSLQSTLNLQLNGKIGPNLYMKGAISDDNIPFQPDGNTQKLQEFDQVYMQIYNDLFSVTAGDFWLKKPSGYFLNYNKRTQGLSLDYFTNSSNHKVSAAYSKGKFARNTIQGIEGNQGPYRLIGAENEQFIIILAGTEKVFIDGEILKRGQEFDYTIDYNTAQISFTANRLVTKDKRIIVEFQYSDLNYARSLFAYNSNFKGEKYNTWINYFSEQDSKNQPIQQSLSQTDKINLSNAGDSLDFAFSNSIDSIGYFDNRVLYNLVDTLGYDSILVFSVNPSTAIYQATFQFAGNNKGNYVLDQFTANGKVYKWVAPISGIPQGDYNAIRLLFAPQQKQMFTIGGNYKLHKSTTITSEFAYSNFDRNTFSKLHSQDNKGMAITLGLESFLTLDSAKGTQLIGHINTEYNQANFNPIQWFRSPEFDRDWNVRQKNYVGDQFISSADIQFIKKNRGKVSYNLENLVWGNDYTGYKNNLIAFYQKNNYNSKIIASWLLSNGTEKTDFLRHKIHLSKNWKKIKIGLNDNHERNLIYNTNNLSVLSPISYQFYEFKTYISSSDSSLNKFELYHQQRYDKLSDSSTLRPTAVANNFGLTTELLKQKNNTLKLNVNYRILNIKDSTLISSAPENTILGRVENHLKLFKNVVSSHTFYELGSGLELKKEFIYIQVNPGQGVYSWIDYDLDGIKDLGEFEIAQFSDQAEYIRVFLPTNQYIRTFSNQFSQSIFIKPERIWKNKKGLKKQLARFSNQLIYKVNRKTNYEEGINAFNPFITTLVDSSLISTTSSFRNTFYFNRINSKFGLDYSYQENGSKILLSNGFDSRLTTTNKLKIRWNISKKHTLKMESILGRKKSNSDYAPSRNYFISSEEINTVYAFQPNTKLRFSLNGKYAQKLNNTEPISNSTQEKATIKDIGFEFRVNQPKKGSFLSHFNYINILYNSNTNSPLAYEMLEGLKTGNNFTFGMSYQRKVAKNLQLNFNYNGRKSENNKTIHTGGMELRAFF